MEETGTPDAVARAEFIRVQCELAAGPADPARRTLLGTREALLIRGHGKVWLAPLRARGEALQNASTHGQFRRGFVELVWMPAAIYLKKADKLFARAPVRELRVTRLRPDDVPNLLAHTATRRLTGLDMSDLGLGDDTARTLAGSAALAGLTTLRLRACNITDAGAEALAATEFDWRPDVIDLAWNPITDAGRAALTRRFPGAALGPTGG